MADLTIVVPELPLQEIYEASEAAEACIGVGEYGQAVECLTKALSLVAVSTEWCTEAMSPTAHADPAHALATRLLLDRAHCHLQQRLYDDTLSDADNVLATARRNRQAKRIKCEALFGLKQEKAAMKLWTAIVLETSECSETDILKKNYPIAAVHVLHAVKVAQADNGSNTDLPAVLFHPPAKQLMVSAPIKRSSVPSVKSKGQQASSPQLPVPPSPTEEATEFSMLRNVGAALQDAQGQTTPIYTNPGVREISVISEGKTVEGTSDQKANSSFELSPEDCTSPPTSSYPSTLPITPVDRAAMIQSAAPGQDLGTNTSTPPTSLPSDVDQRPSAPMEKAELTHKMQLAMECIPRKDFEAALILIDEVLAVKPEPRLLFDRALCVEAIPSFSAAEKIAALTQYVFLNPLDGEWIPHAFYMASAHYLDLNNYDQAARMRYLAEECERVRQQCGKYLPLDGGCSFRQKGDVENAFTPPWLVLDFDQQRKAIESGSLPCLFCPATAASVPLVKYVEHRMTLCPAIQHQQCKMAKQKNKKMN